MAIDDVEALLQFALACSVHAAAVEGVGAEGSGGGIGGWTDGRRRAFRQFVEANAADSDLGVRGKGEEGLACLVQERCGVVFSPIETDDGTRFEVVGELVVAVATLGVGYFVGQGAVEQVALGSILGRDGDGGDGRHYPFLI